MHRLRRAVLTALVLLAVPAASAGASPYSTVLQAYQQHGTIPACRFSSSVLAAALKGVDTYGAQYFADFTAAIQTALSARGGGQCDHVRRAGFGASGAAVRPAAGDNPAAIAPLATSSGAGAPAPVLLMAGLAVALALVAAVSELWRRRGWEPAGSAGWLHAWREAGYRTGGTWAEFVDWLRSA